jgi:XTP/dITP diphosphohydrolase
LQTLANTPEEQRGCRFVSVVMAAAPNGAEAEARGEWNGRVLTAPRGSGGFGYDPLFYDAEAQTTAAEMSREDKNARSHRGKALRTLLAVWPDFWARANR